MATTTFADTAAGGQAPSTGAAAWAASRLGLRVFPISSGTGTPLLKGWPELATTDPEQIDDWWRGDYCTAGVGIATGPESGVWCLDVDVKHGSNGFATLQALVNAHGNGPALTATMAVATPSGGAHLYFRWNEDASEGPGVHNSTGDRNALGPGLDVRGIRGYVRGPGWGGYQVVPRNGVRSVKILAAPGWLTALAVASKRTHVTSPEGATVGGSGANWSEDDVARTVAKLGRTPEGSRNHALNRAAFLLGTSGAVTEEDAWEACKAALVGMGAGDGMDRWRRTFDSGWRAGTAQRR